MNKRNGAGKWMFGAAVLLASTWLMAGCKTENVEEEIRPYPREAVELVAPAGAGSGYDVTAQMISQCLEAGGLVPVPVTNCLGGGGRAALEYLEESAGQDDVLCVFSPPLCLIALNGDTPLNYRDNTTPIAKLAVDYGCFAVKSDSPWQDLEQVMDAFRENPEALRVGGTSVEYSLDHIQFLTIARAAGVKRLGEIPYQGFENGGAAAQLMGGRVDLLSAGLSDVVGLMESGDVRILAVTSPQRLEGELVSQIPTCIEQGINGEFSTWRGIFGPRDMPDYAVEYWEQTLSNMAGEREWREICEKYGWTMDFLGHEDFKAFLETVNREYEELMVKIRE